MTPAVKLLEKTGFHSPSIRMNMIRMIIISVMKRSANSISMPVRVYKTLLVALNGDNKHLAVAVTRYQNSLI